MNVGWSSRIPAAAAYASKAACHWLNDSSPFCPPDSEGSASAPGALPDAQNGRNTYDARQRGSPHGRTRSDLALRSGDTYGWATPSRRSLAAWASRASTAADDGQKDGGRSRRDACRTDVRRRARSPATASPLPPGEWRVQSPRAWRSVRAWNAALLRGGTNPPPQAQAAPDLSHSAREPHGPTP